MITRRALLKRIGVSGGAAALATAMQSLGLFGTEAASALPVLPPSFGEGRRVLVIGAGIAGLVSAYELQQAGFDYCTRSARARWRTSVDGL